MGLSTSNEGQESQERQVLDRFLQSMPVSVRRIALPVLMAISSINAGNAGAAPIKGAPLGTKEFSRIEAALTDLQKAAPNSPTLTADLKLLEGGLTADEVQTIFGHVTRVPSSSNLYVKSKATADALEGKGPALTETEEQKKARLERERLIAALDEALNRINVGFFKKENWHSDSSKGAESTLDVRGKRLVTEYKARKANDKKENPRSTQYQKILLGPGTYKINITGSGYVNLKLSKMDGKLTGPMSIASGQTFITVPQGYKPDGLLEIINDSLNTSTEIQDFKISRAEPEEIAKAEEEKKILIVGL